MKIRYIWTTYIRRNKTKKIMNLSLFIAFTIVVFLIYDSLQQWNEENYMIYQTRELLGDVDNLYNIRVTIIDDVKDTEKMNLFLSELPFVKGVNVAGCQMQCNGEWTELMANEQLIQLNQNIRAGTIGADYPTIMEVYCVEQCLAEVFGLEMLAELSVEDTIPVMAGYSYKDIFSVGDIYTNDKDGYQYQIVGFFPKGFKLPPNYLMSAEYYICADNQVVALYDERMDSSGMMKINAANSIYFVSDGSQNTIDEVRTLADKYDLHIQVATIEELIENYKQDNKEVLELTFLFTAIALSTGIIAIILSSLMRLMYDKQEYGIMYANGMDYNDMFKLIAIENGVRQMLAFIAATIIEITYLQYIKISGLEDCMRIMLGQTLPLIGFIVFILWIICVIIPVGILNRMRMSDMLGGHEL